MISSTLMAGLIVLYIIIAFASACESNWPRALYWVSVSLLTVALLWGTA